MDPEVLSDEPARCPKCGMKLLVTTDAPIADDPHAASRHSHTAGGIEWEDDMVEATA